MSRKAWIMLGMTIGSVIGGYLPTLVGVSALSITSIIFNAIGGAAGVWISYKLTQGM